MNTIELNPVPSTAWTFEIPYVAMSGRFGRAEFCVCVRWRRKRISDVWIQPRQQELESQKMYHLRGGYSIGLTFPNGFGPWILGYCYEHKTTSFRIYVPNDTNCLSICLLTNVGLGFVKRGL